MTFVSRRLALSVLGLIPLLSLAAAQPVAASSTSDVSVTITANRTSVATGQQITYTARMTNHGPNDAAFVDVAFGIPSQLDGVSVTCDLGISPDGPFCEYSSLKAGQTVVSKFVATPHQGGHYNNTKVTVSARILFENDCSVDPNCTFDPHLRNNADSVRTTLTRAHH